MIDGVPGAGKTTFIKRLCYIWAQSVLHPEERDTEDEYLHKYKLVIPIILRFVNEENSLTEILAAQLQCLSFCEICAVIKYQIETNPENVLLLLDGFDEYTGRSSVEKIIGKEESSLVLCITTSRPHAIEQLTRKTSQAVDQHVRLCGFNEQQVIKYITQFCEYYDLPRNTGEELIKTLFKNRTDILEVAKIPIRTEMICIVWAVYGKLGKTLADLYEMFIIHLITHWETKQKTRQGLKTNKKSEQQVLKQNEPLLRKIGQLANTWEKHNRLRVVFSTEELEEILGEDFDEVINIGILTKSHPSNILQESKWSFPHLTIQEYFVAYFLSNTEDSDYIVEFSSRCKEYRVLQRCEVIFMFLSCKYPDVANNILTVLVHEEKDENRCRELLKFIINQIQYYDNSKINIPSPYFVNENVIDSNFHKRNKPYHLERSSLSSLLESDKRQKKPNLHSLTVQTIRQCEDFLNLTYLKRLDIEVTDQEELLMLKQKIQHMKALESLCISLDTRSEQPSVQSDVSFTGVDLVNSIPTDKLTSLSITGPDAMKAAADHIQKFTFLQQLHIDETSTNYTEESRSKLIASLKSNNNIKQVSLCVPDLDDRIMQEKLNMKVKLQVKRKTLRKDSLRKAVRSLAFTGGLYKLELIDNNLKDEGESLGELLARMTTLGVLDLRDCNIQAQTLQAMVQIMKKIKVKSCLHTLYMGGKNKYNDNLHTGGRYLGELIAMIPDLYTLDLNRCNLTDTDLADMSHAPHVPDISSIHTMNLQSNDLDDSSEGLFSLLSHTSNLQALAVGGYDTPAPIPAICRAADAGCLNNLHVLDMSDSKLQPGNLETLGQRLHHMNTLKAIQLNMINGVQSKDFQHVYRNLPSSLQHLNVHNEDIHLDTYLMIEHQHHLKHLQRIHVRLSDSDTELLQEVLEQHNPRIQVNNNSEDTWRIYVTDKYMYKE